MQRQHGPAFPVGTTSSAHPALLSLEAPVKGRAAVADIRKVCKWHLPWGRVWGREDCPGHRSPVSGKQIRTTQGLGSAQQEKASRPSSKPGSGWTTMKVWTGRALGTQKALSHRLERIWLLRVCANWLKANAHDFSYFPEFQRNFKTLPESWGFYLDCWGIKLGRL